MESLKKIQETADVVARFDSRGVPDADAVLVQCKDWGITANLKLHQAAGVSWLIDRYIHGVNVIHGDEMGLGKTLQSIALLAYLKSARSSKGPFLVICPLSVTEGWALEMSRFAPHLKVLRYVGNKEEREGLRQGICKFVNEMAPSVRANPDLPFDVLLTTYELAMADVTFLSRMRWCYAIIDEAQRLKNANSVIMRRAKRKLELTYNVIGRDDVDLETHGPANAGSTDLRSMIMFGVHTLHKSDDSKDVEIIENVELRDIVDAALSQRGKAGSALSNSAEFGNVGVVTLDCQDDKAESFYNYEGKDFTKPADKTLLESWAVGANTSTGNELGTRRTGKGRAPAVGTDEDQEDLREQKRRKAEDKKHAKWQSLGYHSLAVDDLGEGLQPDSSDDESSNDVHFVIGDCTKPVTSSPNEPYIILSFVDNSGTWGTGGMFSAVARLSSKLPEAYEAAHEAADLHLSDLHLVPVSDIEAAASSHFGYLRVNGVEDSVSRTDVSAVVNAGALRFVGVAVIQTYDRRRKVPRSDISMSAFETCLRKVVTAAKAHSASVHVPRVGSRDAQGKNVWYSQWSVFFENTQPAITSFLCILLSKKLSWWGIHWANFCKGQTSKLLI